MSLWSSSNKKSRPSVSSLRTKRSRTRGFLICRLCSRLPMSIGLVLIAFPIVLIFHWSLLSHPFPYSYYLISSESSSHHSFFHHHHHDNTQQTPHDKDPSNLYWKEQHAKNDRVCQSTMHYLRNGGRVLLYNFTRPSNGPGMASLLINFLQIDLFMEERWNRTHIVIAEELLDNYRWDATHGLFGGYLYLNQICVLGKNSHLSSPLTVLSNIETCNYWQRSCPILEIDANHQGFMFERARRVTKRYYLQKRLLEPNERQADDETKRLLRLRRFFHDLSRYVSGKLPGLQLHPHVDDLVQQQRMFLAPLAGVSNPTPFTVETSMGQMDLAFHIRRGDKVAGARKESHAFDVQEYWNRFVNQYQELANASDAGVARRNDENKDHQFQNCFVATDDYQVVSELQKVLQQPQAPLHLSSTAASTGETIIPCHHLWTLTPPNYTSTWQDRQEIIGFLAQMRVLIDAKYFVGSFSSNVGGLVALLRGGHYFDGTIESLEDGIPHTEANRYRHYFDSYAVDWDEWGIL